MYDPKVLLNTMPVALVFEGGIAWEDAAIHAAAATTAREAIYLSIRRSLRVDVKPGIDVPSKKIRKEGGLSGRVEC